MRKYIAIFAFVLSLIFVIGCKTIKDQGPLRLSTSNLRYFTNNSGKGVYLTGKQFSPEVDTRTIRYQQR